MSQKEVDLYGRTQVGLGPEATDDQLVAAQNAKAAAALAARQQAVPRDACVSH
jgi:hypothetical protein